jgi:nicotinamidase-related amidase
MQTPYVTIDSLPAKTAAWLDKVSSYNRASLTLERTKSALLVVDMQNFFMDPASPTYACGGAAILPNVTRLITAFRGAGRPVIYTRHVHHPDRLDVGIMGWWWDGMCVEGSPESRVVSSISPLPNEKVVLKHRYSAFFDTDLATVLRCLKVEDLVISGMMTNMCCESTARDAYYRDYRVFFPADATGTINEEMHLASLLNLAFGFAAITTTDKLVRGLAGDPA